MSARPNQTAVVSDETGEVICADCTVADTPWTRLRGLLGRASLAPGEGLILSPAFAIHTLFMRFPIDAVFVDGEGRIVSVRPQLRPWRGAAARGARAVIELAAGQSGERGLKPGERLRLVSAEGPDVDGGTQSPAVASQAAAEPGREPSGPVSNDERTPGVSELSETDRIVLAVVVIAVITATLSDFGLNSRGFISAAFGTWLAILAATDLRFRVIPNRIVTPAIAIILVAQLAFFGDRWLEWVAAGSISALIFLVPAAIRPGSIGMGDVKLAALLGVGLGEDVATALILGSLAAAVLALIILARRGTAARKEAIPFGPFLAGGGILALFLGGSL